MRVARETRGATVAKAIVFFCCEARRLERSFVPARSRRCCGGREEVLGFRQARRRRRASGRGDWRRCGGRPGASRAPRSSTKAMSSERTGTACSAAAVGVGARRSATWSMRVVSVSWPTAEISGICARGDGADDDLFVVAPEVLDRAAAAGDDEQVGARDAAAGGEAVEAVDGGGDLGGAGVALDADRPDEDVAREAVGEAVEDVADHRAGRRGDDADDARQVGQRALALGGEEAFGERVSCGAPRAAPSARRRRRARAGR